MARVFIQDIAGHAGETVTLKGWVANRRSSGKIHFLTLRDGTGFIQATIFKNDVPEELFDAAKRLSQETAVEVTGAVRADERAPGGFELSATAVKVVSEPTQEYPITPKEHGIDFLLDNRHLHMRHRKAWAIIRVRDCVERAIADFFHSQGFLRFDAPFFMPTAVEGTTNLFEINLFDEDKAYLSQSGQLYAEAGALAFGKVYTFGPTFRAEKSKTRRHLLEFWMVEPEVAFATQEENQDLQEAFVSAVVGRALEECRPELEVLERDTSKLEPAAAGNFPRLSYTDAIARLQAAGEDIAWGDDFGAPHETLLGNQFDRPVIVHSYPAAIKAFYMQPREDDPRLAACNDMLAPEGYGEIIGGSQRIHDLALLESRLNEHQLPREAFEWYLDLRRYGSVPHAGFGLGVERTIAWITGIPHLREAIPFPRMLTRMRP
ncbi:MAG TPA: asparagine--tRNA ligase [Deinococcales bacterium]|nr:asparagine--tRNA ligase [Deinococcales bacterium]